MIKKGILIGLSLYLAVLLGGMAFTACSKAKSDDNKLLLLLLMSGSQSTGYFVNIPAGVAY